MNNTIYIGILVSAGLILPTAAAAQSQDSDDKCWSAISRYDGNGDGILGANDFSENAGIMFAALDGDKDGKLSREEYEGCFRGHQQARTDQRFDDVDLDRDGVIVVAELTGEKKVETSAKGAQIKVEQAQPTVTVEQAEPAVRVEQGQSGVSLEQEKSEGTEKTEASFDLTRFNADQLIGMEVETLQGNDLGAIEDVVIDGNNEVYFVIDVGGFLGFRETRVAIPAKDFKVDDDKLVLQTSQNEDDLSKLLEYEENQYATHTW